MTNDAFGPLEVDPLDREGDRWGRPKIVPPNGGKGTRYTRVSTFAKALDDTAEALTKWKQRMTLLGAVAREDILAQAATLTSEPEDRDALNDLCEAAITAAKGDVKRELGTAFHRMTEQIDRGERKIGDFPKQYRPTLQSYLDELDRCGLEVVAAEMFVVHDEIRTAGTYDRLLRDKATGELVVGDIKTGSVRALATAIQVAVYAHSTLYQPATGERIPYPVPISLTRGVFMHVPQDGGSVTFSRLDLETGWAAALICRDIRNIRNNKPIGPWTSSAVTR